MLFVRVTPHGSIELAYSELFSFGRGVCPGGALSLSFFFSKKTEIVPVSPRRVVVAFEYLPLLPRL